MSWDDYYFNLDYEDESPRTYVWVNYDSIRRETDKAYLFVIEAGDDFAEPEIKEKTAWIPKSQIEDIQEKKIFIPDWLAGEKGLI